MNEDYNFLKISKKINSDFCNATIAKYKQKSFYVRIFRMTSNFIFLLLFMILQYCSSCDITFEKSANITVDFLLKQ